MNAYAVFPIMVLMIITPMAIIAVFFLSLADKTGNGPHRVARLWGRLLVWACFVRVEVQGRENVDPSGVYVFAANHSSTLDIILLLAYLPFQFRWLAKEELFRIPFFGRTLLRAGYIPVNRTNPRESVRSLERAAERIQAGASVVIFPEGTRSQGDTVLPFKRGGFTLAVKSGKPIVPVTINGAARILPPKTLNLRPGRIKIVIGQPIPTEGLGRAGQEKLLEEVREAIISNFDPEYGRR